MILILAESTDPWAILVNRQVQDIGGDVLWVQSGQLLDRILLNWPVIASVPVMPGTLVIDGRTIPLDDLTGMFTRLHFPLRLDLDGLSDADAQYVTKEATAAWLAFLNAMPCSVVNRPMPGGRPTLLSGSPLLATLVQDHGFLLLASRCTSSQANALRQFKAWGESAYLKPLGSIEPGQFLYSHDGVELIRRVMEQQAVSIQAIPHGQRVTVYVVGEEVVATVLQPSEDVTQRIETPSVLSKRCLGLVGDLGLTFTECQFIVTPEGPIYCLDVSSAPGFWCCPQDVQPQIVCRLVEYLSKMRSLSRHDSPNGPDGRSSACERLCETLSPQRCSHACPSGVGRG